MAEIITKYGKKRCTFEASIRGITQVSAYHGLYKRKQVVTEGLDSLVCKWARMNIVQSRLLAKSEKRNCLIDWANSNSYGNVRMELCWTKRQATLPPIAKEISTNKLISSNKLLCKTRSQ